MNVMILDEKSAISWIVNGDVPRVGDYVDPANVFNRLPQVYKVVWYPSSDLVAAWYNGPKKDFKAIVYCK